MCGIYGVLALRQGYRPEQAWLERMGGITVHRGPDDSGSYVNGEIALGMRRLSVIDVKGGHQPLSNEDGSIQVVCNGEIYNFRQLRGELEKLGYRFKTRSDSEVLVHLYRELGLDLVHRLDGMFAFAIWDQNNHRLVLGRDRIGIKPLYYLVDDRRIIFASEIKSILEVPGVRAEIDHRCLDELLALGYCPAPLTLFRGIRKLNTGSLLVCENGREEERAYWRYTARDEPLVQDEEECRDRLLGAIEKSVVDQMISDVSLGAFLSGGIDSSCIVAFMARNSAEPVKTYSIGFDTGPAGRYYNELPHARQVAEMFGTEHREILVRPDVARLLPQLIWHMDEPLADSAMLTTFLVAEFARKDVTVILSGAGGDELFGGYRRYLGTHYSRIYNHVPQFLRRHMLAPLARSLPSDRHGALSNRIRYARQFLLSSELAPDQQYASYVTLFSVADRNRLLAVPVKRGESALEKAFRRVRCRDPVNGLMQVDFDTQLPDDILLLTDKMTMAASIECRVPLLSNALVDLALTMPGRLKVRGSQLKHMLRLAMSDVLSPEILNRPKRGFGAPMGAWLKNELKPIARMMLAEPVVARRGLLNPAAVAEAMALHDAGKEDYSNHLQCLLNLEIWCRMFLDGDSVEDVGKELSDRLCARASPGEGAHRHSRQSRFLDR